MHGLDGKLLNSDYNYCIDWIEEVIRLLDKKATADFITTMVDKPMLPLSPIPKKWEKPLRGTVKIKFDATISKTKTGFGVILVTLMALLLVGAMVSKMRRCRLNGLSYMPSKRASRFQDR
ncbi:hypothetical protein CXB51_005746 [Gossypium anomalum]|uniref:Uncharacterized protein n=1 Tax=Gossypium anomalum TaxID=47600 RepID=A0A8J6D8N8_9ROSI|nr:hypothetical protein CXB51_005746 [Gossypium anomalum]